MENTVGIDLYDLRRQGVVLDPNDLKFLVTQNGLLLFLLGKLLCNNPRTRTFHLRRMLVHYSLSVKKWTNMLHSFSIVRSYISREWKHVLDLSVLLRQLVFCLSSEVKVMYEANSIDTDTLDKVVSSLLEKFSKIFKKQGIPLIDVFAVFNSFKKGFCFFHDGKYFYLNFGSSAKIIFGRSKISITLKSSTFFPKLYAIMRQLGSNPAIHDMLCLMYQTILRNHNVGPRVSFPFEMTISQNYGFWVSYLNWDRERTTYLNNCLCTFVARQFGFSNKDHKYYLARTKNSSFDTFFGEVHIRYNEHYRNQINVLSFDL